MSKVFNKMKEFHNCFTLVGDLDLGIDLLDLITIEGAPTKVEIAYVNDLVLHLISLAKKPLVGLGAYSKSIMGVLIKIA